IFLYHGLHLVSPENQYGAAWATNAGTNQGLLESSAAQLAVAWGQVLGGAAMVFGFLTRLAAAGLIVIMVGAIAVVHWPHGFDVRHGGYEFNFAIIVMCLAVMLLGAGNLAVDRFLHTRWRGRAPGSLPGWGAGPQAVPR